MPEAQEILQEARRQEAAGELDRALETYRRVGADSPLYPQARIRIVGLALLRGSIDDAEREARDFVSRNPELPDSHATLGQVLRLRFRFDEAIAALTTALQRAPDPAGFRVLLNDARRARYWTPDATLYAGLRTHVLEGGAGPQAVYRFLHCCFLGILSPEVQQWIADPRQTADETPFPDELRKRLDEKFAGRFTAALGEVLRAWRLARPATSPYAPQDARITLRSGKTLEGAFEDADSVVGGALEAVNGDEYVPMPFGEADALEFGGAAAYVQVRFTPRSGRSRNVEMPALYFFTEGCRIPEVREGRRTLWRLLDRDVRIGLGLRQFSVETGGRRTIVGLADVRKVDFFRG